MSKRKILIQLDSDRHASLFDRIVALDAGCDVVASYAGVVPEEVEPLVHGAIFTRGPDELAKTAFFIGGHNVVRGEELCALVERTFFGPFRCSVMLDANGANTTAAAAVLAAGRHLALENTKALVLGGTGPVGQRVARLLAGRHAAVWLGSRSTERASDVCDAIAETHPDAHLYPIAVGAPESISRHPERFHLVVAAGAAGVRLVHREQLDNHGDLKVLIDLNAVPPTGIEGVEPTDSGRELAGVWHYGALGVGGTKMKIHRAAIARLFTRKDLVLDAEQIFQLALQLDSAQ